MKRTILILLLSAILLSVCSCTPINDTEPKETQKAVLNTKNIKLSYTPHIYTGCWCLGEAFNSTHADKDIENMVFGTETTIEDVEKAVDITLLGKTYTATYEGTTWSERNQQKTHKYILADNKGTVYIDANIAKITDIYGFAYDETLKTESDYTNLINAIVGATYDLSKYDLTCYTILTDNKSKVENRFIEETEESRVSLYKFDYTKKINGFEIRDSVKVEFKVEEKKLWIDLTDRKGVDEYYYPLIECIENFDSVITDYMNTQLKDGFTVLKYSVDTPTFEIIDGKAYDFTVVWIEHKKASLVSDSSDITSCFANLVVEIQYTE